MPNWCLHKLTVTRPKADAQAPKEFGAKHKPCKWTKPSLLLKTTAKCGSYSVPFSAASATKLEPLPTGLRRSVSPGLPRRIWFCLMWTCPMVRASISVVPSRAAQTWPPSPSCSAPAATRMKTARSLPKSATPITSQNRLICANWLSAFADTCRNHDALLGRLGLSLLQ